MAQSETSNLNTDLSIAINQFLNAPPAGTPAEIIEMFGELGREGYLPPKVFIETVKQAPIAISITDPNAHILFVNEAFEQLTGYVSEEILGKNQSQLSSKSTPQEIYQDLWQTIQGKQVWRGQLVNHKKNKQEYLAELSISPVLNANQDVAYFLGMHRDVTKMHQLEQRLSFQQNLTEAVLNAVPMVVALISSDGKVLMDNHPYKALMGDFRGVEPASLFIEALSLQLEQDFSGLCGSGQGFTNIDVRLEPSGNSEPRWFSCSGVHMAELDEAAQNFFLEPDRSRCYLLLIANEVTSSRRRTHEARLNMIRANMSEQQMVQTMREAISASIFKLQVPLNVIKAAMAIPTEQQNAMSLKNILAHAKETGEEAMDSLHNALPEVRMEASSQVNLNEIVHDVIRLSTDKLLSNGVVIDWRPSTVVPNIEGRANALRGLFKYLMENSIKAVSETRQQYREIRLETEFDEDEIVISFMDNGPGIPAGQRLRVYEPFYCGWENPGSHSGMGLTLAQEIVINHGGSLEIDEDFLGGCRIFVRLPVKGIGGEN